MIPNIDYLGILDRWTAWIDLIVIFLLVYAAIEILMEYRRP